VKKVFALALGVLTAIGGFVDIGDLVTNATVGSRFGTSLVWVTALGGLGIIVFAEMSGRVVAMSGRPTFDIIRERLGPRVGLANLFGSMAVTLLTYVAEIGGVALSLELATSVWEFFWVPFTAAAVWIVLWRAKFDLIENAFGLLGLALVVFAVALWQLGPDWSQLWHTAATAAKPKQEAWPSYWYYAVALFGAAMTPYEVFFFSSGGVEEKWDKSYLPTMRANVFVGFSLGVLLSLSITGVAAVTLLPIGVQVDSLGQVALPVAIALGRIGLAVAILGFFAATFGAACETGLSVGYSLGQYFGWQWGKGVRPREASRFHAAILCSTILAGLVLLTTVDPVLVTEASVVFSALALPLTYLPILIVANDPGYMGSSRNKWLANGLGSLFLGVVLLASLAAIPLMIWTKMGTT
jgi:Mn2+/Fe2+ NRAMP family transporter